MTTSPTHQQSSLQTPLLGANLVQRSGPAGQILVLHRKVITLANQCSACAWRFSLQLGQLYVCETEAVCYMSRDLPKVRDKLL